MKTISASSVQGSNKQLCSFPRTKFAGRIRAYISKLEIRNGSLHCLNSVSFAKIGKMVIADGTKYLVEIM